MITVVEYDPTWPARFAALRRIYESAMRAADVPVVSVEHVGSTSVPGLAAKPVIDCDIVVKAGGVARASDVLVTLGFTPEGELGIPQRWAFREPVGFERTNTYVVVDGCLSLRNHLGVREVLRADAALRDEYAAVKRQVAVHARDLNEYVHGKSAVLQKILTAAGIAEDDRIAINRSQMLPPTRK